MSDTLTHLENELKKFDWFYAMSDDHRNWQKGKVRERELNSIMNKAASEGLGGSAAELYNKYNPSADPKAFEYSNSIGVLTYNTEKEKYEVEWTTKEKYESITD